MIPTICLPGPPTSSKAALLRKETAHHRQRSACDSEALEVDTHYLAGLLRTLDDEGQVLASTRGSKSGAGGQRATQKLLKSTLTILQDFYGCSMTRALEMEACSKAWKLLTSDDSHDLFTSTSNFVQKQHFSEAACRTNTDGRL